MEKGARREKAHLRKAVTIELNQSKSRFHFTCTYLYSQVTFVDGEACFSFMIPANSRPEHPKGGIRFMCIALFAVVGEHHCRLLSVSMLEQELRGLNIVNRDSDCRIQ